MNNNLGYVLTVEKMLKLEVTERAQYIRVLVAELNRIASHLIGFGSFAQDLGAFGTPLLYCFRDREKILDIFDELCGNRLTYNYLRIGGIQADVPPGFDGKIKPFVSTMRKKMDDYDQLLTHNAIFLARSKKIGVLPKDLATSYSVTGPNLRGSGIKRDLRKDRPYLVYDKMEFEVPVGSNGDAWDRFAVRLEEIRQSLRIIEQAIGALPEGNPVAKVGRIHKPPAGDMYLKTENPRGELGFYISSDGSTMPLRLKVRAPSFSNLAVLPELVKGTKVADVICILGSLDVVMGEIDR
jgi:NADH-quinone oxidoreductase subunit D